MHLFARNGTMQREIAEATEEQFPLSHIEIQLCAILYSTIDILLQESNILMQKSIYLSTTGACEILMVSSSQDASAETMGR